MVLTHFAVFQAIFVVLIGWSVNTFFVGTLGAMIVSENILDWFSRFFENVIPLNAY